MKRISIIAAVICSLAFSAFAQKEETLLNGRGLRLTGAWGGTSIAGTQLNNQMAALRGGWGGIELNKHFFVGYGAYESEANVRFDEFDNQDFKLQYSGLMLGYGIGSHKTIHPQLSGFFGRGTADFLNDAQSADRVYLAQPQLGLELNVARWFRFGLNGGYRFLIDSDITGLDDKSLSGPYGEVVFKFGWSWGRGNRSVSNSYGSDNSL